MNAAISGIAGVAVVVDGEQIYSIHADTPNVLVPREPWEYRLLMQGADDVEFFEHVERDQITKTLLTTVRYARALQLALVLLDGTVRLPLRARAGVELEDLFADPSIHEHVQAVLYSLPLPASGAVQSALLVASGPRTRQLVAALTLEQPAIRRIRTAWDEVVRSRVEDHAAYRRVRAQAVKRGMFSGMVAYYNRDTTIDQVSRRAEDTTRPLTDWHRLIGAWAMPFEQQWHESAAVVERYWGYLDDLWSTPPIVAALPNLSFLRWPRPRDAAEQPATAMTTGPTPTPVSEVAQPVADVHKHVVESVNGYLHYTDRLVRRRRLLSRVWSVGSWTSALAACGAALAIVAAQWLFTIDFVRQASIIALLIAAAGVFRLLDLMFGTSRGWVTALLDLQNYQAAREQFELDWARSLAPLSSRADDPGASVPIAAQFLARVQEISGAVAQPVASGVGGARLVLGEVDGLQERTVSLKVDGEERMYVGTSSIALILPGGIHAVTAMAMTKAGAQVHSTLQLIVEPGAVTEAALRLSSLDS